MFTSIAFWRAEHTGFGRLLDLLEKKLAAFHTDERPDYELMLDTIQYLRNFSDRYHHPREDVAFACLAKRDPSLAPLVERLHEEHRLLAAAGNELHRLLTEALADAMVARDRIEAAAADYLVLYRQHIASEEVSILPRAIALLTAEDWEEIARAIPPGIDPLFGAQADPAYHQLRKQIALEAG